ncbi:MAG: LysE family translocator [Chromatiales bacterium]|nr:LysE family translocator [Chromatiales bacterium]
MALDLYLAFVVASAVVILVPGPNVTLLVAQSLALGPRRAAWALAGTSIAMALQLLVVWAGIGVVLEAVARWFEWLRWLGVAYLVWLGLRHWRAAASPETAGLRFAPGRRRLLARGFLVSATNPKSLLFFAAFLPQFVDPARDASPQLALLCTTFLALAVVLDGAWMIAGGRARGLLSRPGWVAWRERLSGTLLLGVAAGLALARRSP